MLEAVWNPAQPELLAAVFQSGALALSQLSEACNTVSRPARTLCLLESEGQTAGDRHRGRQADPADADPEAASVPAAGGGGRGRQRGQHIRAHGGLLADRRHAACADISQRAEAGNSGVQLRRGRRARPPSGLGQRRLPAAALLGLASGAGLSAIQRRKFSTTRSLWLYGYVRVCTVL